jgi:hypothetical protein
MTYILFVWMVVAGNNSGWQSGWHNLGTFKSVEMPTITGKQLCEDAAKQLGLKAEIYRCVRNG